MFFISLFTILLAFLVTIKLVPKTKNLGIRYSLVDVPNSRKQHKKPIVRIGGLAISTAFLITLAISFLILKFLSTQNLEINYIFIFIFSIYSFFIIGVADDIYQLSPIYRLVLQLIIVSIGFFNGISLESLDIHFLNLHIDKIEINPILSYVITIFWLTGIPNAINWMDGLDGLAAGIAAISFSILFIINLHLGLVLLALISLTIFGCLCGFLRFNLFPAKVMMGDGGSNFIGSLLAYLSLLPLTNFYQELLSPNASFRFFYPLIILFIPILDMIYVIISRIIKRKSPFFPDRSHLHHRLLNKGFSHKKTVDIILKFHFLICLTLILGLIFFQ